MDFDPGDGFARGLLREHMVVGMAQADPGRHRDGMRGVEAGSRAAMARLLLEGVEEGRLARAAEGLELAAQFFAGAGGHQFPLLAVEVHLGEAAAGMAAIGGGAAVFPGLGDAVALLLALGIGGRRAETAAPVTAAATMTASALRLISISHRIFKSISKKVSQGQKPATAANFGRATILTGASS